MGSVRQEGGSEGRGLGPGTQQASWFLSGQGRHWPRSLPFLCAPPPPSPSGSPPSLVDPYPWVGPPGCRNSSPPPATPQGCRPRGLAFTFAPPSIPPTPSGPVQLEGASLGRGSGPGISTGSWASKWAGETWPHSLLILCPPSGSPISPFGCGIPSPPTAAPQGRQSHPTSTSPPPSLPPMPHVLPGHWGFLPSP